MIALSGAGIRPGNRGAPILLVADSASPPSAVLGIQKSTPRRNCPLSCACSLPALRRPDPPIAHNYLGRPSLELPKMPSKTRTDLGGDGEQVNGHSPSLALPPLLPSSSQPQPQTVATKKPPKTKVAPQPPPSPQVLVICRNKCASIPTSLPRHVPPNWVIQNIPVPAKPLPLHLCPPLCFNPALPARTNRPAADIGDIYRPSTDHGFSCPPRSSRPLRMPTTTPRGRGPSTQRFFSIWSRLDVSSTKRPTSPCALLAA